MDGRCLSFVLDSSVALECQSIFSYTPDHRFSRVSHSPQQRAQPVYDNRINVDQGREVQQDHKSPDDLNVRPLFFCPSVALFFGPVEEPLVPEHEYRERKVEQAGREGG